MCEKDNLERKEKWYEHCPEQAVEEDGAKLICYEGKQTRHNLVNKKAASCIIIDLAIPGDCRIREKEIEKIEKYHNLKRELKRLWWLKKVEVVPVVVGALGCISKGFSGWMDTLGIKLNVGMIQKSVLMVTARILMKVLDMYGESILLALGC